MIRLDESRKGKLEEENGKPLNVKCLRIGDAIKGTLAIYCISTLQMLILYHTWYLYEDMLALQYL